MSWETAPAELVARSDEVHVFRLDLAELAQQAALLRPLLNAEEDARAARFVFDRHRFPFIGARASLRAVLGAYLGLDPRGLLFDYGKQGKPSLRPGQSPIRLSFNLSHAHERALIAVSLEREVGVDVEYIRPDFTGEDIWERFFSERERAALRALPEAVRPLAFFQCWTRKEAYIKATGPGLSTPLHSFDVSLGPGVPAALLATRPDAEDARRWTLHALEPGEGYAGAVMAAGSGFVVRCYDWPTRRSIVSAQT